jgi:type IV secretion system protein VirB10
MKDDQNNSPEANQVEQMTGSEGQENQVYNDQYQQPGAGNIGNEEGGDFYYGSSQPMDNDPFRDGQSALQAGEEQFSAVAGASGNKKIAIAAVGGLALGALVLIFMPETKTSSQIQEEAKQELETKKIEVIKTAKPVVSAEELPTEANVPPPKALEPPPLSTPQPPEPPPAPEPVAPVAPNFPSASTPSFPSFPQDSSFGNEVGTSSTGIFSSSEEEEARKRAVEERRKSGIMVKGGSDSGGLGGLGGGAASDKTASKEGDSKEGNKETTKKSGEGFLGFGEGTLNEQVLTKTGSAQISATYIGRLDSTIAQGKIIDAVLETAINTDLPGTLRAIVSRDVYAESGKAILIPKGSRVIGTYAVDLTPGQSRVNVTWDRLIRPDGIDLALGAPGTDTLGRSGAAGYLDDKLMTKLSTAFLISYIIPSIANKIANVNDKSITSVSTTNTDGSTSTTTSGGTVGSSQLKESADQFKDITQKALEEAFSTTSTIYVDQGTRINIFVNKDIVFPPQIALNSQRRVVQ